MFIYIFTFTIFLLFFSIPTLAANVNFLCSAYCNNPDTCAGITSSDCGICANNFLNTTKCSIDTTIYTVIL